MKNDGMLLINFPVLETSASNTSECFKANSAKSISERFIKNLDTK